VITVFFLGGTISMATDASGGAVATLGASDLLPSVPGVDVTGVDFRRMPSASLGFDDLLALLADARAAAGPVVIVQGTDTIEETAFFLDLLWDLDEPVVVTGAMRTPEQPGADGPANLVAAISVAASEDCRGLGALVVMDDQIHAARYVSKRHTSSTSAFLSPGYGPLGHVVEGSVRIGMRVVRRPVLPVPSAIDVRVAIVPIGLGEDGYFLPSADRADGVVVAGVGGGHVPERLADRLGELAASVPVVLASRTGSGPVLTATYGAVGAEIDLIARGLVPAGELDPYKARLLLAILLAGNADGHTIAAEFSRR